MNGTLNAIHDVRTSLGSLYKEDKIEIEELACMATIMCFAKDPEFGVFISGTLRSGAKPNLQGLSRDLLQEAARIEIVRNEKSLFIKIK